MAECGARLIIAIIAVAVHRDALAAMDINTGERFDSDNLGALQIHFVVELFIC